jgi:hypothetical protein
MQAIMPETARQMQESTGRDARGRYIRGFSGNTKGSIKSKRYEQLYAELVREFGEPTAMDAALLSQAVNLLCRGERAKNSTDAVRCANTASRLLAILWEKRKREPTGLTLTEYVALKANAAGATR